MLTIAPNSKVYLYISSVDFRKQIPGLKKWIQREMHLDPLSGAYFFFMSKNKKSIKVFFFDGQGISLYQKRLSQGTFQKWKGLHDAAQTYIAITPVAGSVMLMNGNSHQVKVQENWKEIS